MLIPIVPTFVRSFATIWEMTSGTAYTISSSVASRCFVVKIPASQINGTGSTVRVTMRGPTTSGQQSVFSAVTISNAATSGDAFDSAAAPVALTFGGSASLTLAANAQQLSDPVTFTPSGAVMLAFDTTAATTGLYRRTRSGLIVYTASGTGAATANRSSFVTTSPGGSSFTYGVIKIEAA